MIDKFGIDQLVKLFQKKEKASATNDSELDAINSNQTKEILSKQVIRLLIILIIIVAGIILIITLASKVNSNNKIANKALKEASEDSKPLQIEIASGALDPEKMWRNHFEDKLLESNKKLEDKLSIISESFNEKEQDITKAATEKLALMQEQLNFAREELLEATQELKLAREINSKIEREENADELENWQFHKIDHDSGIGQPKSSRNFIPETAYVSGVLLGGISVSTGVSSAAEPTPVIIRVTGTGNLPKNFELDLKTCRILGSSYGDLSSERAIIRAEVLSCTDNREEQIVTTKVAGMIFGDDGVNGIKGRVVQASNKQIRQAFVGGLLSGFANTAKGSPQFALTSSGAVSTKNTSMGERLRDNSLAGFGNAGEKIADYYLKQAESMSPVLQIPAGSKVEVVFTKGVYLGSEDVRSNLARDRRKAIQGEKE